MPQIRCGCKRILAYRPEQAGRLVKCPGCAGTIRLPEATIAARDERSPLHSELDDGRELRLETPAADIPLAAPVAALESAPPLEVPRPRAGIGIRRTPASTPDSDGRSYWRSLPGAFRFPLTADGLGALIVAVVLLTVGYYLLYLVHELQYLLIVAVGLYLAYLGVVAYLAGCLMAIIERSAHGDAEPRRWPDLTEWDETVLKPFLFALWVCVLSVGPCIAYRALARPPDATVFGAILGLGLFYMPMGLLCAALESRISGLNPALVLRAVGRVPGRYCVAWALFVCCVAAEIYGGALTDQIPVPVLGAILQQAVVCYLLFVAVRVLGLLYLKSGRELNWLTG